MKYKRKKGKKTVIRNLLSVLGVLVVTVSVISALGVVSDAKTVAGEQVASIAEVQRAAEVVPTESVTSIAVTTSQQPQVNIVISIAVFFLILVAVVFSVLALVSKKQKFGEKVFLSYGKGYRPKEDRVFKSVGSRKQSKSS